jgi:hypothetical protein
MSKKIKLFLSKNLFKPFFHTFKHGCSISTRGFIQCYFTDSLHRLAALQTLAFFSIIVTAGRQFCGKGKSGGLFRKLYQMKVFLVE